MSEKYLAILGGLQKHQIIRRDGISPCLKQAMGCGGGQTPIVFMQSEVKGCAIRTRNYIGKGASIEMGTDVSNSLTTVQKDTMAAIKTTKKIRIRRLTPRETWRLMGFDDADFDRAKEFCCDSQLYKQAGNSIVTDCIYFMAKKLLTDVEDGKPCNHDWRRE